MSGVRMKAGDTLGGREIERRGLGEARQPVLGRGVGGRGAEADEPEHRGHVDDHPTTAGLLVDRKLRLAE